MKKRELIRACLADLDRSRRIMSKAGKEFGAAMREASVAARAIRRLGGKVPVNSYRGAMAKERAKEDEGMA